MSEEEGKVLKAKADFLELRVLHDGADLNRASGLMCTIPRPQSSHQQLKDKMHQVQSVIALRTAQTPYLLHLSYPDINRQFFMRVFNNFMTGVDI